MYTQENTNTIQDEQDVEILLDSLAERIIQRFNSQDVIEILRTNLEKDDSSYL